MAWRGIYRGNAYLPTEVYESLDRVLTDGAIGLPPEKWSSLMYGLLPDGGLKNAKEETHG